MATPTTEAGKRKFTLMSQRYARFTRTEIAEIEAEATAVEHERAVDACAKLLIEARASQPLTLDVERLARAIRAAALVPLSVSVEDVLPMAGDLVREYNRP